MQLEDAERLAFHDDGVNAVLLAGSLAEVDSLRKLLAEASSPAALYAFRSISEHVTGLTVNYNILAAAAYHAMHKCYCDTFPQMRACLSQFDDATTTSCNCQEASSSSHASECAASPVHTAVSVQSQQRSQLKFAFARQISLQLPFGPLIKLFKGRLSTSLVCRHANGISSSPEPPQHQAVHLHIHVSDVPMPAVQSPSIPQPPASPAAPSALESPILRHHSACQELVDSPDKLQEASGIPLLPNGNGASMEVSDLLRQLQEEQKAAAAVLGEYHVRLADCRMYCSAQAVLCCVCRQLRVPTTGCYTAAGRLSPKKAGFRVQSTIGVRKCCKASLLATTRNGLCAGVTAAKLTRVERERREHVDELAELGGRLDMARTQVPCCTRTTMQCSSLLHGQHNAITFFVCRFPWLEQGNFAAFF